VNLLGTCKQEDGSSVPAVLLLEKTAYSKAFVDALGAQSEDTFTRLEQIGQNDVYNWMFGWPRDGITDDAHTKMTLICPADDAAVAKYSAQERTMIIETPDIYERVTRPWIDAIPESKKHWVYNILDGKSERESVLYRDDDPKSGFIILPDLKWDRKTLSSLYLVAIVRDGSLTNLRDLRREHIPLLRKIQEAGARVAHETFGMPAPSADGTSSPLRCFLHYMPTFFHLHVHLLSANFISHPGSIVGQAHLLEDVASLLELGVDFRQRTIGYSLAEGHKLLAALREAGVVRPSNMDGGHS